MSENFFGLGGDELSWQTSDEGFDKQIDLPLDDQEEVVFPDASSLPDAGSGNFGKMSNGIVD